jgi:VanZ family protein
VKAFGKWLPAILIMGILFAMSSATGKTVDELGMGKPGIQLNVHLVMYFLLCIAFYKATKDVVTSTIFTVFYGVFDELHQLFTLWRNSSLFDIKIDTLGAILAAVILWKLQHILPKKLKIWLND